MANIKVSQLPRATTGALGTDYLMVISNSANKKVRFDDLLYNIKNDVIVNSTNAAAALKVYGSSGNTQLLITDPVTNRVGVNNDSPDETLHISGNVKIDGTIVNSNEAITFSANNTQSADPGKTITFIDFSNSNYQGTISIGPGGKYQKKTFVVSSATPSGCNVTLSFGSSFLSSTIPLVKFNKQGDSITLVSVPINANDSRWTIMSSYGVSIT